MYRRRRVSLPAACPKRLFLTRDTFFSVMTSLMVATIALPSVSHMCPVRHLTRASSSHSLLRIHVRRGRICVVSIRHGHLAVRTCRHHVLTIRLREGNKGRIELRCHRVALIVPFGTRMAVLLLWMWDRGYEERRIVRRLPLPRLGHGRSRELIVVRGRVPHRGHGVTHRRRTVGRRARRRYAV